jgi:hypothetical protein
MPPLDARAVDQDTDLVPVGEDPRDEGCDVRGRAEVGCVDVRGAAQGADGGEGRGGGFVSLGGWGLVLLVCLIVGGDCDYAWRG